MATTNDDGKNKEADYDGVTEKATFRLPTSLLNQFRHLAIDKNTTITSLLVESMKEYISKGGR
jgi:hypothetical protein